MHVSHIAVDGVDAWCVLCTGKTLLMRRGAPGCRVWSVYGRVHSDVVPWDAGWYRLLHTQDLFLGLCIPVDLGDPVSIIVDIRY